MSIAVLSMVLSTSCTRKKDSAASASSEAHPQLHGQKNTNASLVDMIGEPNVTTYPPIGNPRHVPASEANAFLSASDSVFYVRSGKTTYVYPEVILAVHHVVNDVIDKRPVLVTLCLMADSAILYSRVVGGKPRIFGALGTATMHRNFVMCDFETDSYWTQLQGESFHGKRRQERLEILQPLEKATWAKVQQFGRLKVVPPEVDMSFYRDAHRIMLGEAAESATTLAEKSDRRLKPDARGLGVVVHGQAQFYPIDTPGTPVVNDRVGAWALLVLVDRDLGSPRIFRRYLDGRVLSFVKDGAALRDRETRSEWSSDGLCVSGALKGERLGTPTYVGALWYSWSKFHPRTGCYSPPQ